MKTEHKVLLSILGLFLALFIYYNMKPVSLGRDASIRKIALQHPDDSPASTPPVATIYNQHGNLKTEETTLDDSNSFFPNVSHTQSCESWLVCPDQKPHFLSSSKEEILVSQEKK